MINSTLLPISTFPSSLLSQTNKLPSKFKPFNTTNNNSISSNNNNNNHNNGERGFSLCQKQTVLQQNFTESLILQSSGLCKCGRRHFVETIASTLLIPSLPSLALEPEPLKNSSSQEMLNKFHPPRPDWYQELYASVLSKGMQAYEAEVAGYKSLLFNKLRGQAKEVLEIGIGTGPNLKYYAGDASMCVFGVDPNRKMEKYARGAAEVAVLPPSNFEFIHAVGEALPVADASVDAVIGTLVLCSVKDVDNALEEVKRVLKPGGLYLFMEHVAAKDGTLQRFAQNILDPLQQLLADGCHLTRETGRYIAEAGFSGVESSMAIISNASFINPHVYGIARK